MDNSQARVLIPSNPISITDELIHKDLDDWSKDLLKELNGELQSEEGDQLSICAYLNQAALISSLRGKVSEARRLCQLQIDWLKEKIEKEGLNIDLFLSILQPWINMGRLNHIEKKYALAIPHFDMAEKVHHGKDLLIHDLKIPYSIIAEFLEDPERGALLDKYLRMNHIEGLIKIYVSSGNYLEGLSFVEEQRSRKNAKIELLLDESELILLLKMGKYEQAWNRSQQFKPRNPYKKLVLLYYTALISHFTKKEEYARKYGIKLANYMSKATKEVNFIDLKKLLLYTARLCKLIGLGHNAHILNEIGFDLSRKLDDQRYGINFGLGLSKSNMISEEEKQNVMSVLNSHLSISHYRIRGAEEFKPQEVNKPDKNLQKLQKYIQYNFAA